MGFYQDLASEMYTLDLEAVRDTVGFIANFDFKKKVNKEIWMLGW